MLFKKSKKKYLGIVDYKVKNQKGRWDDIFEINANGINEVMKELNYQIKEMKQKQHYKYDFRVKEVIDYECVKKVN